MTAILAHLRSQMTRRHLRPPLGFMHVPKAAGTWMVRQIDAELRPRRSIYAMDRTLFGDFEEFDTMDPEIRSRIVLDPADLPAGADVVAGHLGLATITARQREIRLATVLREPRARLLSHWLYWRSYDDEVLARYGGWQQAMALSRLDFPDFLAHAQIACIADNLLVRMLLSPHPLIPLAGFIDPQHDSALIAAARSALARFHHVGIAENPSLSERFAAWARHAYGRSPWAALRAAIPDRQPSRPNEARASKLRGPPILQQLAAADDKLAACTRLDRMLWEQAAQITLQQADIVPIGDRVFADTLQRYTAL
jgi:hypothetical protein